MEKAAAPSAEIALPCSLDGQKLEIGRRFYHWFHIELFQPAAGCKALLTVWFKRFFKIILLFFRLLVWASPGHTVVDRVALLCVQQLCVVAL